MTPPLDTIQFLPRPAADATKFYVSRGPRPMLARDADSVYWMSRYVERAEHVARILLISGNLLTDVGHLDEELVEEQWRSILTILQVPGDVPGSGPMRGRVAHYMTFDEENPSSLITCVSRARENARGIRETISQEMWECLNTLYWSLRGDDARSRFEESPDDFFRSVMSSSFLFQGLTDHTLAHDQRWMFTQLGKFLERTIFPASLRKNTSPARSPVMRRYTSSTLCSPVVTCIGSNRSVGLRSRARPKYSRTPAFPRIAVSSVPLYRLMNGEECSMPGA
jgi:hypothetical protein